MYSNNIIYQYSYARIMLIIFMSRIIYRSFECEVSKFFQVLYVKGNFKQ